MSGKAILIVWPVVMLLFCGQKPVTKHESPKPGTVLPVIIGFTIQSPAFLNNEPIPVRFTGKGQNVSPALHWYNPPGGAQSFVLIVDDPDAPSGTFTHWVIYNLPKDVISLPEAVGRSEVLPGGGRQLQNSARRIGYDGPMPPPGKVHHYVFTLHALDTLLDTALTSKDAVLSAAEGHVLAKAVLTGTYKS